jgi:hypothetical protein
VPVRRLADDVEGGGDEQVQPLPDDPIAIGEHDAR